MTNKKSTFAIGDVVYNPMMHLDMTVSQVHPNGEISTMWFTGTEIRRGTFNPDLLVESVTPVKSEILEG